MNSYTIREFRLLRRSDSYDIRIKNWSRAYEWIYAIHEILADADIQTVHNTCCGSNLQHLQFAKLLSETMRDVTNSDKEPPAERFENFHLYDITTPASSMYDCVLSISAIEDLLDPALVERAIRNLIAQARRRVICTFDYPSLPLEWLSFIGPLPKLEFDGALTGSNSWHKQDEFSAMYILLLDLVSLD